MLEIEDAVNQIHHGKWEDVINTLPNNSVDIVITSPPYNVDLGNNKFKKDSYAEYDDNMPYDEYLKWMELFFAAMWAVMKDGGRICVNVGDGANGQVTTHADFTVLMKKFFVPITTIVWDKKQIGNSTAWGSWLSPVEPSFPTQFEFIMVMGKGGRRHEGDKGKITVTPEEFKRNSRALWRFLPETRMMQDYDHPAMFPEELPRRLIQQLTYQDDVVLDPFSGAGTTCCVAKELGRKYIGIEMSEKYYKKSLVRLSSTASTRQVVDEETGEVSTELEWMS